MHTPLLAGTLALFTLLPLLPPAASTVNPTNPDWREKVPDGEKPRAWSELEVKGGKAFRTSRAVYFELDASSRKVEFPRLNNRAVHAYPLGQDPGKARIPLKSEPSAWSLELPEGAGERVIVLELREEPHLAREPHVIRAGPDGVVHVPAHHAVTYGKWLRYEPQPHKNTVGYWIRPDERVLWHLDFEKPGQYFVEIFQGCGKGQGGSTARVHLSRDSLEFTVEDTGHFQNFKWRRLGVLSVSKPGETTLELRALRIAKKALLDVRAFRLVPVAEETGSR